MTIQGAAPKWSVGAALCLGASKLLTLCHFTPLAPSAAISLACFLLFAVALPWVHPPIIPPRSSLAHASSGGSSMSSGGSGGMSISNSSNGQDTNPLSAQTGFLLWVVGVAAIRNARTTVLAPLLDETFGYGSSSAVVVAPDGSSEAVVVSLREQCLEVALATLLAVPTTCQLSPETCILLVLPTAFFGVLSLSFLLVFCLILVLFTFSFSISLFLSLTTGDFVSTSFSSSHAPSPRNLHRFASSKPCLCARPKVLTRETGI